LCAPSKISGVNEIVAETTDFRQTKRKSAIAFSFATLEKISECQSL
jgi:hypothetical protein